MGDRRKGQGTCILEGVVSDLRRNAMLETGAQKLAIQVEQHV